MNQPELGKKIVELRKAKGFTQEELVKKCNLSVRTLQRIESGEVTPRSYTIKAIFSVLDFPIYDSLASTLSESNSIGFSTRKWLEQFYLYLIDLFNLKTNTMKKISILSIPFFTLSAVLFIITTQGNAQNSPEKVKKIIEQANTNCVQWFNEGKIDSLVTLYRDDACMVSKGCGKEFLYQFFTSASTRFKYKELKSTTVNVSDTIAVENGNWVLVVNESGETVHGEYLTEWHLTDGKWKIVKDIANSY